MSIYVRKHMHVYVHELHHWMRQRFLVQHHDPPRRIVVVGFSIVLLLCVITFPYRLA